MYGLTRATTTLFAAGVAGLLVWVATRIDDRSTGGYWAVYGLIAGAGLVMALSQLLGGWTKWGMPRLEAAVFLLAFVPVLVVAGWVVVAHQPHGNWARNHVLAWSGDIHVRGLVGDLVDYVSVLAFGIGLVFGYSFDTTGPRQRVVEPSRRDVGTPVDRAAADEPLTADRAAAGRTVPSSGLGRLGRRRGEPVASDGRPVEGSAPVDAVDR
jgi:hypothetical protein